MRYFTIEQRETLRDVLTNQAADLRDQDARIRRHGRRFISNDTAKRLENEPGEVLAEDQAAAEDTLQLHKVEQTLVKLRSPEFGICEDCQGDIAYVLLRNDPFTTLCRECQQRRELAPFVPNEI